MPSLISKMPWATFGRRETWAEIERRLHSQRDQVALLPYQPRFSVVIDGDSELTRESVKLQSYPHWDFGMQPALKNHWKITLKAGDVLNPQALFHLASEINKFPHVNVIYTNEVFLNPSRTKIVQLFSKCDYSRFTQSQFNYMGNFKASKVETSKKPAYHFLPLYLLSSLPREMKSTSEIPPIHFPDRRLLSVIICFKDRAADTIQAAESVFQRQGKIPVEICFVDNQSDPAERKKVENALAKYKSRISFLDYPKPFNFGAMNNKAIRLKAKGDFLFLLNNDVILTSPGTLDELVAWADQKSIGTVGICLTYPDGKTQHSGLEARFGGEARLVRLGNSKFPKPFSRLNREVFGNSFAACVFTRECFNHVGGLTETGTPNGFGDVAFNFEALKKGYRNVYIGNFTGIHAESASRGIAEEYGEEWTIENDYSEILQIMLRRDLSWNKVPDEAPSFVDWAKAYVNQKMTAKFSWWGSLKPALKEAF